MMSIMHRCHQVLAAEVSGQGTSFARLTQVLGAVAQSGSAPRSHRGGQGFESPQLHLGSSTELPVSYRQNCGGDLIFSMTSGSDTGAGRCPAWPGVAAGLLRVLRAGLRRGLECRFAGLGGGGAGGGGRPGVVGAWAGGGRARQARILRMLAAISSRAVKTDWAAMPRTRRRAGWARASWAGALVRPLSGLQLK